MAKERTTDVLLTGSGGAECNVHHENSPMLALIGSSLKYLQ